MSGTRQGTRVQQGRPGGGSPSTRLASGVPALPRERALLEKQTTEPHARELVPGVGRPLPSPLREEWGARLGLDLRKVRLHTDAAAARAAEELGADAFTQGEDVVFGAGRFQPDTGSGRDLLAHELTHVGQQQAPGAAPTVQRQAQPGEGLGSNPPAEPFVRMIEESGSEDDHVLFDRDSATLDASDQQTLRRLVGTRTSPVTVHVHGYASREGDEEYNLNLSAHRAVAVKQFLEELLPVGSRVIVYAHGETTEFGRLPDNRRAGVDVIEQSRPASSEGSGLIEVPPLSLGGWAPAPQMGPLPRLSDLLPPGLGLLPPLTTGLPSHAPPAPLSLFTMPRFDEGTLASDYSLRGIPYTERDARSYQQHFTLWFERFVEWGMPRERAAWLAQLGTEKAARTQLSLEHPIRTESLDRLLKTEPTTIPIISDSLMRWLFERYSR